MSDLRTVSGVYLAEFPDWLKVGRATYMRDRLREHAKRGAHRFVAYRTHSGGWPPAFEFCAEDVALDLFERRSIRMRSGNRLLEQFVGLTWDEGLDVMREAVTLATGGPAEEIQVDLRQLDSMRPAAWATITEET